MSKKHEEQYIEMLSALTTKMEEGKTGGDRTGVGTSSIFGITKRYENISESFPLLETKRVAFGLIKSELLWFIKGNTNIKYLLDRNNHIWDEWAFERYVNSIDFLIDNDDSEFVSVAQQHGLNFRNKNKSFNEKYEKYINQFVNDVKNEEYYAARYGDLGPVYGKQWRNFNGIDQLSTAIKLLKEEPTTRRAIISAWNPKEVFDMALPPCHVMFQFNSDGKYLDLMMYQRSGDMFLGVPFNIASYSLLLMMVAKETGLIARDFVHTIGNAHLYTNHIEQAKEQLLRFENRTSNEYGNVKVVLDYDKSIFDVTEDDIKLEGYNPMKSIKAPVAV